MEKYFIIHGSFSSSYSNQIGWLHDFIEDDGKQYSDEIICFYSDNDPYVKYEVEKEFADKIATEQVFIPNAGHINSESGYDTFEDIVSYLQLVIKNNRVQFETVKNKALC